MSEAGGDRGHLLTERPNPASEALDRLSTAALVELFCANDLLPQQAVAAAAPALAAAIDAIVERLAGGGRLFYLGAGTSGRLGVLDAAECPPTFCSSPELVQGVLAGGAAALLRSSEGLEDLREAGRDDLLAIGDSVRPMPWWASPPVAPPPTCWGGWPMPVPSEPSAWPWPASPPIRRPCPVTSTSGC